MESVPYAADYKVNFKVTLCLLGVFIQQNLMLCGFLHRYSNNDILV